MARVLFVIGVGILCLVAGVVGASGGWIFWDAWSASDRDTYRALIGGFAGAFFAFLFVRIGEGLKRLFERQEKNHACLTRLQHYLNTTLSITGDNWFIAKDFISAMSDERLDGPMAPLYLNRFLPYSIDGELLIGLTNIDYINELYALNMKLRKVNGDLQTTNRAIDRTETLLEPLLQDQSPIRKMSYVENMRDLRSKVEQLCGFLDDARTDLVSAFAMARTLSKHPPFFLRLLKQIVTQRHSKSLLAERQKEVEAIEGEMTAIGAAGKKRIEEIRKRTGASPGKAGQA